MIQDNLNIIRDRNGKIEDALVKGAQLQAVSNNLKKNSTTVNKQAKRKSRCYCVTMILIILAVIAGAIFALWFALFYCMDYITKNTCELESCLSLAAAAKRHVLRHSEARRHCGQTRFSQH